MILATIAFVAPRLAVAGVMVTLRFEDSTVNEDEPVFGERLLKVDFLRYNAQPTDLMTGPIVVPCEIGVTTESGATEILNSTGCDFDHFTLVRGPTDVVFGAQFPTPEILMSGTQPFEISLDLQTSDYTVSPRLLMNPSTYCDITNCERRPIERTMEPAEFTSIFPLFMVIVPAAGGAISSAATTVTTNPTATVTAAVSSITFTPAPVPEPSTLLLGLLATVGLLLRRRI